METTIKKIFIVFFYCLFPFFGHGQDVSVMYYNVCNYFVDGDIGGDPKDNFSKACIVKVIKSANPDILIVTEIGSENSFNDFVKNLEGAGCSYPVKKYTSGVDASRHIVMLSKIQPATFQAKNDLFYKIKPKDKEEAPLEQVGVQRGFLHATFKLSDSYTFHVIGAHLKSRLFHARYNQTDMRRYEARLLRYFVNEIQEKEPEANILVFGDMNDTYDTDAIKTIRASSSPEPSKILFDLRPVDFLGMAWTHWWNDEDTYGRIDYAFANFAVLPEIVFNKNKIVHLPECWMFASDHRPLFVVINPTNKPAVSKEILESEFTDGVRIKSKKRK